jgi:filamentous hemagglutinin
MRASQAAGQAVAQRIGDYASAQYAGVGGGVSIGHSNGPISTGSSKGGYAEVDAGFGPSGSINFAINDDGTIGGIVSVARAPSRPITPKWTK